MSNTPQAKKYIDQAVTLLMMALPLLDRKKADFRAPRESSKMTSVQKERARRMRAKGWSTKKIAERLNVHPGRISEAVHEND